jgi:hypothetical protein
MRYRLRTLLIAITLLAVSLSVWRRIHDCRRFAHEHHYASLRAGYTAIKMQGLALEHHASLRGDYTAIKVQGSSFDRATMTTVYPYWEDSIRHSQLADHYMQVTKKPWIIFLPPPTVSSPPPLPAEDAALRAWWEKYVANYVAYNGLDCNWGSYFDEAVSDRNIALLNVHPDSFNRFLALTNPELFEEGNYLRPKQPTASR